MNADYTVTSEEIEQLENPTIEKQVAEWTSLIKSIDEEKLKALVDSVGYRYVSHHLIHNHEFNSSPHYLIDVVEKKLGNSEKQLILKLTDPHPFFKRKKTTNEIAIVQYLKDNTTIPVPSVLSFSKNRQTSLIGCEYILMHKCKGKYLREEFKQANEVPEKIIHHMIDIFKQLKEAKLNQKRIGCFDESMNICTSLFSHGPIEASSDYFSEYVDKCLTWITKEMTKIKKFKQMAQDLEVFKNILNQICRDNPDLNNLNFNDDMHIVNSNLSGYNILIDPITFEIVLILNWDSCYHGFDHKELEFFQDWFRLKSTSTFFDDRQEEYEMKKRINHKIPTWYNAPRGYEVRRLLDDLIKYSINLVFYTSIMFKEKEYELGDHLDYWYYELARKMKILPFFLIKCKEYTKGTRLRVISDEELESLDNPNFLEQELILDRLATNLTDSKLKSLIESIGFKYITAEPFKDNMGMVNKMYIITVHDKSETKQLILRLTDVHPFFTNRKTTNEVAVMKYLKENSKIPVPNILSFSYDKNKSPIGCEYILMDKIEGELLGDIIDKKFQDVNKLPDILVDQMINIIKELKSLKLNQNQMGCFDLEMNIASTVQYGINIEPCENFLEYIKKQLEWCIKEINKIKIYKKVANELEAFRENLIKVCSENKNIDNLNFHDEMSIYHGDLHAGNIFVNPDTYEITGIIDWEWAGYGFDDVQLEWILTWYDSKESKRILKKKIQAKSASWYKESNGKEFRNYLKELLNFKFLVFYLASILKHSNCEPKDWSFYFYCEMNIYLKTFLDYLNQLKEFTK